MATAAAAATQHKCNIILIGDASVGKTSLLNMYTTKSFSNTHLATLGLDYATKTYTPQGSGQGNSIQVKIWDTAGQERFRTLTQSFYKQAHGIILCFDVTNANSFKNVRMWLESIHAEADENVQKILVGNKIDREDDRKIGMSDAQKMAEMNNMEYFEASAKENIGVNEFMVNIMEAIYQSRFTTFTSERLPTFKLRTSDANRDTSMKGTGNKNCKC